MYVVIFFLIYITVNFPCSSPYHLPDRCTEHLKQKRSLSINNKSIIPVIEYSVPVIEYSTSDFPDLNDTTYPIINNMSGNLDILDLAKKQEEWLKEKYANYPFNSVALRGQQVRNNDEENSNVTWLELYSPYNCVFKTYNPRSLSSVYCHNLRCKLIHTVSTVDTYAASDQYKIAPKINGKIKGDKKGWMDVTWGFEVGGEFSFDYTYTCTYTKGLTTTETVECEVGTGNIGKLQLYLVKSDMVCNIGTVTMKKKDDNDDGEKYSRLFSMHDIAEIRESASIKITCVPRVMTALGEKDCDALDTYMIDVVKISDRILEKFNQIFPYFNPYSDTISILNASSSETLVKVMRYELVRGDKDRIITVPFTNENGDAVYQYACIFTSK